MDLALDNLQKLMCHKTQPTSAHWQDVTQDQLFKLSLTGWNSEFSFS